jgi:hypothetical protein
VRSDGASDQIGRPGELAVRGFEDGTRQFFVATRGECSVTAGGGSKVLDDDRQIKI